MQTIIKNVYIDNQYISGNLESNVNGVHWVNGLFEQKYGYYYGETSYQYIRN